MEEDISYPERRPPQKSRNIIIRSFDYLCARPYEQLNVTRLEILNYIVVGFAILWPSLIFPMLYHIFDPELSERLLLSSDVLWIYTLLICGSMMGIRPWAIYRHYRHRYIKYYDLPGPHGWGTIDPSPHYTYK